MAALVTQSIVSAGLTEAMAAATAGGDTMTPGTRTYLRVTVGATGPTVVTITCQVPCSYGSSTPTHDLVVSVPANTTKDIGFIDPVRFGRSSDGQAVIAYSQVVTTTVGAFSM